MNRLFGLIGTARSGTTWVGTILDSHPDAIYRFEPFHRLRRNNPEMARVWQALRKPGLTGLDWTTEDLYRLLKPADPLTNKPPYFDCKSYPVRTLGRNQVWAAARLISPVSALYRRLYSPQADAPLIFKEETFVKPIQSLLRFTDIPIVYLTRHPCATALSEISGAAEGKRRNGRLDGLEQILQQNSPELFERYGRKLRNLSQFAQLALLWRSDVETIFRCVRSSRPIKLMTYEQFLDDPYDSARSVFEHFELNFPRETRQYLNELYAIKPGSTVATWWGDRYFSVKRNPQGMKDAWKKKVSAKDRASVEQVTRDSPTFQTLADLGGWD